MTREEAIEVYNGLINTKIKEAFEFFVPELRESDDERIRKELIRVFRESGWTNLSENLTIAEAIAYLEKQKDCILVPKSHLDPVGEPGVDGMKIIEKQKEQKPIKMEVYEIGKGTTICGQDYKCKKDYKAGNCWYIKDTIYHCGRDGYLTDQNGVSWSCTPEWFNEYIQSNTEWAEEEKNRFVSGQFLQCKLSFDGFKEGKHYWLEYIGDDMYVGRSDNVLNQKFHITPRQLYTLFSQQLEEVQGPPQEEKQVPLNYEPPFNENPSDREIIEALIKHLKEQDGILTAIDCISTKAILSWLEKQKEQKPSTEETELNSIAFLEQMGYTCIPPQKEQKPAEWSEDCREEDIQTRFAFYTYKDDPSVLYLSNVFVEETSRNHGFGTRILKAAEKAAEAIGAITICLKVKQDSPANAWYRKRGYGYVAFEDEYDWLEKNLEYLKPVKQEWSEEDEKTIDTIVYVLGQYIDYKAVSGTGSGYVTPRYSKEIDWLKSLRPQSKIHYWTEEEIEPIISDYLTGKEHYGGMIARLKCLKPKSHWKPSEEQMEALWEVEGRMRTNKAFTLSNRLASLYNDLQKLM